jgi:hypothetical protein
MKSDYLVEKVNLKFNLNVDLENLNAKLAGGERSIKSQETY